MATTYNTINVASTGGAVRYASLATFPPGQKDGELAVAIDTNIMYVWDSAGLAWTPISAAASVVGSYFPESLVTITATDISNGYILLSGAPTDKDKTKVYVIGGTAQAYGADFIVTNDNGGTRLSFDGLGLSSIIEIGDQLSIAFN